MNSAQPIKRVHLATWWFAQSGGMERHITDLAKALQRSGVDVTIFSEQPVARSNQYRMELAAANIFVIAPGSSYRWIHLIDTGRRFVPRWLIRAVLGRTAAFRMDDALTIRPDAPLLTRAILGVMARHPRPDVLHVHGCRFGQFCVVEWAARNGIPSVYTDHVNLQDWGGTYDKEAPARMDESVDVLTCVSEQSRQALIDLPPYRAVPREVTVLRHIVPMPVTASVERPASATPVILCVARLSHHKGVDVLLNAACILRKQSVTLRLRIAGDGPDRASLEALAHDQGIAADVEFLGDVEPSRIAALWGQADIGVLASRTEGLPLSLLEAMSQSKAMVVSRAGGMPELIRDGLNGLLVDIDDAAGLATAIRRLVEDPGLRKRLGAAARESLDAGGWSEDAVLGEIRSIYGRARELHARKAKTGLAIADWVSSNPSPELQGVRRVYVVAWSLSKFESVARCIVDQACGMAQAGVEVFLFVDSPWIHHEWRHRLRCAGVKVRKPSVLAWTVSGAWSRLTGGSAASRLAAEANPPDAIHIHGWRLGRGWHTMRLAIRLASELNVPCVYTEYAPKDAAPPVSGTTEVSKLSAASASAGEYLAAHLSGSQPVHVLRHGEERPARKPYQPDPSGQVLQVLALVHNVQETTDLSREFEIARTSSLMRLDLCARLPEFAERAASGDVILVSQASEHFALALVEAMSFFQAIVVIGPDPSPISHRANGFIASFQKQGSVAAALSELASDPLLRYGLGNAARRTYETSAFRPLALAEECLAMYRSAETTEAAFACR